MKKKSYTHMSVEERETLSLGLAQGHSLRTMATMLGRAPSTISRESARNAAKGHPYRGATAAAAAQTPGSLAVAVCPDTRAPRVLARTDCRTPPSRVA